MVLNISTSHIRLFVLQRSALIVIFSILSFRSAWLVVWDVESVILEGASIAIMVTSSTEHVR